MKKFGPEAKCVKCGGVNPSPCFEIWREKGSEDVKTEAIRCECLDCGFSWDMLPLDAKTDEPAVDTSPPAPVNIPTAAHELWRAVGEIVPSSGMQNHPCLNVAYIDALRVFQINSKVYARICEAYRKLSQEFGDESGEILWQ